MRLRTGFAIIVGIAALAVAGQGVAAGNYDTSPYTPQTVGPRSPPTYQPKVERPEPPKTYVPKVEGPKAPSTYTPSGPTFTNRR